MEKTVVLGVSGGIAAFKILELIPLLQKQNISVEVVMTAGASQIVSKEEIETLGVKTYTQLFEGKIDREKILKERKVEHIELAKKADLIVVVPATANVLAKLASGIADDYLTTLVSASTCPVILCPSMNVHMWENPATVDNVKKLQERGFQIIQPDSGMLACGYEGQGRLAAVSVIAQAISVMLGKQEVLKKKKIIVTSGGTIERIDDVRFITNRSSGKMGVALAEQAYLLGADVMILRAKASVKPRFNIQEQLFETAEDLDILLQSKSKKADILIHAAAVSDFTPEFPKKGKISSNKPFMLTLIPQKKILDQIKTYNPNIFLVGFKALSGVSEEELKESAKDTLKKSHADLIVANEVSQKDRGFEADTNEVLIMDSASQTTHVPLSSKTVVAQKILELVIGHL